MKFPRLVLKKFCKTPCEVVVYDEGLTEDGAPKVVYECRFIYPSDSIYPSDTLFLAPLYCNYQDRVKTVYTSDKKKVECTGVLLIPFDFCPNSSISSGYVTVNGVKREIVKCIKGRNPDGTVNYVELDVM